MRGLLPAAFLFLALLCAPARAQMLWPGTSVGMSVDDVQHAFTAAHAPAEPKGLPGGRGIELLQLDDFAIAGHTFAVSFYFKNEKLTQVALFERGEIPFKDFEKFRDLLRQHYAMEYQTVNSTFLQVTWKIGQTIIVLKWTPENREIATLTITYDAPFVKENFRL